MKCCAVSIGILCLLAILGFTGIKIAQNWGVARASHAKEMVVLNKLDKATARETLESFFWGVNNHSPRVVDACLGTHVDWDGVKKLELLSIKEIEPERPGEKRFVVKFKPFSRFGMDSGLEEGHIYEWTFSLYRKQNHWIIGNYGMC